MFKIGLFCPFSDDFDYFIRGFWWVFERKLMLYFIVLSSLIQVILIGLHRSRKNQFMVNGMGDLDSIARGIGDKSAQTHLSGKRGCQTNI